MYLCFILILLTRIFLTLYFYSVLLYFLCAFYCLMFLSHILFELCSFSVTSRVHDSLWPMAINSVTWNCACFWCTLIDAETSPNVVATHFRFLGTLYLRWTFEYWIYQWGCILATAIQFQLNFSTDFKYCLPAFVLFLLLLFVLLLFNLTCVLSL